MNRNKKTLIVYIITLTTWLILAIPFFLPDEYLYVYKEHSVIRPLADNVLTTLLVVIGAFATHGIYRFWKWIFKKTKTRY